eukprot:1675592-Alexandrium_andersonii.AAC.1
MPRAEPRELPHPWRGLVQGFGSARKLPRNVLGYPSCRGRSAPRHWRRHERDCCANGLRQQAQAQAVS